MGEASSWTVRLWLHRRCRDHGFAVKEFFNLKMSNFYLEEKIQNYVGGEEDTTDHYRELKERNTSLKYEKYELEKRLEEFEAKCMEVSAAFPTGCPGSQCGLPWWLCASTYIFIRFLQDIWTETYSFPVLSSPLPLKPYISSKHF